MEALVGLVGSLPPAFPHAMLVVLHVSPTGTSVLPTILARACSLPVRAPADGEPLRAGHVYVAPPDVHLVVDDAKLHLSRTPRENGHRPAIDPTMRTAAAAYGAGTIGIVLTGARHDGTAGLMAIKAAGGTAIVQDPDEALHPAMPLSAIAHLTPDAVLPIGAMAAWIVEHVRGRGPTPDEDDPGAMAKRSAGRALGGDRVRGAESFERRAGEADRVRMARDVTERTSGDQAMAADS